MAQNPTGRSSVFADVRARRKDLGLTQQDVAELAGVSARFVMELEQGKATVRLDKLTAVLDAMGLTLSADLRQPSVSLPDATESGVKQSGVKQSGVKQPRVKQPGVKQPGVKQPRVKR